MKLRIALAAMLVVAIVAVPAVAEAATYNGSGRTASAWGEFYEEGAEFPAMAVNIYGGATRYLSKTGKGKPERGVAQEAMVWIDYPEFDPVEGHPSGTWTSYSAIVSPYDMGIDRYLTGAQLHADVEGVKWVYTWQPCAEEPDCWEAVTVSEEPVMMEIDIDWTGVGPLQRYRSMMRDWTPEFRFMTIGAGRNREAAVVGSIIVDGADLIEGIELTGYLDESRNHSVDFGMFPE